MSFHKNSDRTHLKTSTSCFSDMVRMLANEGTKDKGNGDICTVGWNGCNEFFSDFGRTLEAPNTNLSCVFSRHGPISQVVRVSTSDWLKNENTSKIRAVI